jgi:hypothetical protein
VRAPRDAQAAVTATGPDRGGDDEDPGKLQAHAGDLLTTTEAAPSRTREVLSAL